MRTPTPCPTCARFHLRAIPPRSSAREARATGATGARPRARDVRSTARASLVRASVWYHHTRVFEHASPRQSSMGQSAVTTGYGAPARAPVRPRDARRASRSSSYSR